MLVPLAGGIGTVVKLGELMMICSHPLKTATFAFCEQLSQVIHCGGREGDGLMVVGVVDPQAAVLRLHIRGHVPQQGLVLAEDFGGAAEVIAWAGAATVRRRGPQGPRGANSRAAARPGR
jgi:hypothetical protein